MTHLQPQTGSAGLFRWTCAACGWESPEWYRTPEQAIAKAREHSYAEHPEYHDVDAAEDA